MNKQRLSNSFVHETFLSDLFLYSQFSQGCLERVFRIVALVIEFNLSENH